MGIASAPSTFEVAKEFFTRVAREEAASPLLSSTEKTVSFEVVGGEPFTLEFRHNEITVREGSTATADLRVEVDVETCLKLLTGRMSPAEAFHQRRLWFDGIPYIGYPWLTRLIKIGQVTR